MKKRKVLPKYPHQFIYHVGLGIRRLLIKLSGCLINPSMAVYEKAQGFWISRAIVTACELNIADHLASGPVSISELARLCNAHENSLYRLMRTLSGEGIFKESGGKLFMNTRLSSALKEGDNSMKYLFLHQFGETSTKLFSSFTACMRSGENNSGKLLGKNIFKYLQDNPSLNEIYNKAMDNSSGLVSMAILSAYDFKGIKTLVDIGGGHGFLLIDILEEYSTMQGILFDQEHIVAKAGKPEMELSLLNRFQVVGGNFFHDIPTGADAYFMKNILHVLSDDECMELLRKIYTGMAAEGKLIIFETVIKPDNNPSLGKRLDLLMMTGTEGGKERTREEFTALLGRSGFHLSKIIPTITPFSVLEAVKK